MGGGGWKTWEKLYMTATIIQKAGRRWMDEQSSETGWTQMGILTVCDKTVKHGRIQACTQNFSLGGGVSLRLYII
jgi:hypothetical protein